MVASGFFPDSTSVSPYRLVMHLVLALLLYGAIMWIALGLLRPVRMRPPPLADPRACAGVRRRIAGRRSSPAASSRGHMPA